MPPHKKKLVGADHVDGFIPLKNNSGEYCPEEVLQIWSVRRKKSSEDPLPEVEHSPTSLDEEKEECVPHCRHQGARDLSLTTSSMTTA